MERGPLVPLHWLRPAPPAAPPFTPWATRPGCRGRDAPPRGCCFAPPSRSSRPATIGPSGPGRVEPAAHGGPPRTFLRPARDPPAMAPGPGATALDLLAPTAGTTGDLCGHGFGRPSFGPREPDLGLPAGPWGAGQDGRQARALERVGGPRPARDRARTSPIWADMARVPAIPGDDDARLRLLHGRHRAAPTRIRPVLHRGQNQEGLPLGRHLQPGDRVGHLASPQPELAPGRALSSSQVPYPGQGHEVLAQFRRSPPRRGHQGHQDARSISSSERVRGKVRRDRSEAVFRPAPHLQPPSS